MFWPKLLLWLHLLGVIAWVGGMLVTLVCVHPALTDKLEPPARIQASVAVLERFLGLVWIAMPVVIASGLIRLNQAGFNAAPRAWHLMFGLGMLMATIFIIVWFGPFTRLRQASEQKRWAEAAQAGASLRKWVAANLLFGVLTTAVATLGLA